MDNAETLHAAESSNEVATLNGGAVALPNTVAELMENRKNKTKKTLNDHVEQIFLSVFEKPEFQRLLDAVYPEQAVEGSLIADDFEAARMIREQARKVGNAVVYQQKLATLVKSMNVVARRYGASRKERREA